MGNTNDFGEGKDESFCTTAVECSSQGVCEEDLCICNTGFWGTKCQFTDTELA